MFLPKKLIGRDLSLSAFALYPALQYLANIAATRERNYYNLDITFASRKAGLCVQVARFSLAELLEKRSSLLKAIKNPEKPMRKTPVYRFTYDIAGKQSEDDYFFFDEDIIRFNIWASLLPRTKVVYLTLLAFSKVPESIIECIEGIAEAEEIVYRRICDRWAICEMSMREIIGKTGSAYSNSWKIVRELERYQLAYRFKNFFLVR